MSIADTVVVSLEGTPVPVPPFTNQVASDRTVTIWNSLHFRAAGLTTEELASQIRWTLVSNWVHVAEVKVLKVQAAPALAVSLEFCGYTNDGRFATFELTDDSDSGSIAQYSGPYAEVWSGTDWKEYGPADNIIAEASKHMRRYENMEVPVPPGRVLWRAYVSCVFYSQRVQGRALIRSQVIRNDSITQKH